jgi:hypothetical protein
MRRKDYQDMTRAELLNLVEGLSEYVALTNVLDWHEKHCEDPLVCLGLLNLWAGFDAKLPADFFQAVYRQSTRFFKVLEDLPKFRAQNKEIEDAFAFAELDLRARKEQDA